MALAPRRSATLVVLALLVLAGILGLQRIRDYDYWWHARSGALIAETGEVPRQDPFTYTVPGARWIDIHWLFQLGLHGVRSLGGHDAVVLAKVAHTVALGALLIAIGWRREAVFAAGLGAGLALLVAGDRFMARPELPSFVLLAALLWLLDRHERRGGRLVLLAIPLHALWTNLHGLFAVGLAVLAIAVAAEALRPLVMPGERLRRDRLAGLLLALAGSIAAALVNPNGVDGLLYPVEQLRMVGPVEDRGVFGSVIAELLPPLGEELPMNGFARALFATLAGLALLAIGLNWRRASAFDPLAWSAFGWLALGAHRNVALFALVAAAIVARNAGAWIAHRGLPPRAVAAANVATALLLAAASVDVARDRFFERMGSARETGLGSLDFFYPVGAVDWIERERPPGPIAHHMAVGGYLIDRLWPAYRAMSDGRLEVYGPETFARLQLTDSASFRRLDEEYRFGVVLVHYSLTDSRELLWWLHLNPNWRLVHVDESAALFVRDGPEARRWPAVDVRAPDLFPPLPDVRSPSDRLRRLSRVHFLASMGRFDAALAAFEEALARYPSIPDARGLHAWLLQENGFSAAAEAILRDELVQRPDDAALHVRLAELRAQAGDAGEASTLLDRALALDPNDTAVIERRAQLAEAQGDTLTAEMLRERLTGLAPSPAWLGGEP